MDTASFAHGDAEASEPGCEDRAPSTSSESSAPREGRCTVTLTLSPVVVDALFARAEQEDRSPSDVANETLHEHLVGNALQP